MQKKLIQILQLGFFITQFFLKPTSSKPQLLLKFTAADIFGVNNDMFLRTNDNYFNTMKKLYESNKDTCLQAKVVLDTTKIERNTWVPEFNCPSGNESYNVETGGPTFSCVYDAFSRSCTQIQKKDSDAFLDPFSAFKVTVGLILVCACMYSCCDAPLPLCSCSGMCSCCNTPRAREPNIESPRRQDIESPLVTEDLNPYVALTRLFERKYLSVSDIENNAPDAP